MNWRLKESLPAPGLKDQSVNVVKHDSNGEYAVSAGSDKLVHLWNLDASSLITSFEGHSWDIADVGISPDRVKIASVGGDKGIFVWDVSTGNVVDKLFAHSQRINCVAFSSNSSVLASGSNDRALCLWDMRSSSKKPLQQMTDAQDSISSVLFGNCQVISGSVDGAVRCYDLRNQTVTKDDLNEPISCISLNIDGSALLCSLMSNKIVLLDRIDGKILANYTGHLNEQFKVFSALTYDDCYVASGSEDGDLLIWDLVAENPIQRIRGAHAKGILGLDRNPTKMELISGSIDGTIKIWTI